jgi:hypothetical protein
MRMVRILWVVCLVVCFSAAANAQTASSNGVPFISQVTPPSLSVFNSSGGPGSATFTIIGANFPQNAQVSLTANGTYVVHPTSTTVNSSGSQITAQFTNNVPPGPEVFAITVTNPNGMQPTISNAFYLPQTPMTASVLLNQNTTNVIGGAPQALLTGNLQNNGLPSLAIISQSTNTFSTELDSYSGFETGYGTPTGRQPWAMATGEFLLGDEFPEFAVTNSLDNTISLMVANGENGSYRVFSTVSLPGIFPTGVVAGDFNGDGKMDLAVVNTCGSSTQCFPQAAPQGPGSVTILLGNGDGTFSVSSAQLTTGNIPYSIATADLNGDGILDLVVANSSSNTLSIFMGNGDGTFAQTTASPATGNNPTALAIADFNNDGFLDIAVTNGTDNTVSILLNQNCPSVAPAACMFTTATSGAVSVGGDPVAIAVGDLNADGFLDLVVANSAGNNVSVLLGNGTGAFSAVQAPQGAPNFSTGNAPDAVVLGDFNQDGRLDIITSNQSGSYSVMRQAVVAQVVLSTNESAFTYGIVPTFSVQIEPPPAPSGPTGTVTLFDGSTQVSSYTLSGSQYGFQFILQYPYFVTAGTHQFTAVYSGDTNFAPITSNVVTETVSQSPTTTSLSASPTNAPYGTSVTLSTSIQPEYPSPATGTVTFTDITTSTTLGTVSVANNAAQLTLNNLSAGSHVILVTYQGDANCTGGSSSTVSVTVTQASTTETLSASPNQAQYGQSVTFTAALQSSTNASATGTVTFYDGSTSLGTANVANNSAALSVSSLSVGTHNISAQYSGSSNFTSSSGTMTETIVACSTIATLTAGISPSVYGSYINMTVHLAPAYGSLPVGGGIALGQVSFYDGTTLLGTQTITQWPAALAVQNLTAGTHTLTAQWLGSTNLAPSTSNAVTQVVTQSTSTTSVYTLTNPSFYGQSINVTVGVDNTYHLISSGGTVTLFDNGTQIGIAAMSQGTAFFPGSTLVAGSHSLTASYSGDNDLTASSSSAFTQTVNQAATTTSVSLSASSINYGQSVTFTAAIHGAYSGTPTGTVTFLDASTTLGSASLASGSAQFSTSSLTTGTHNISAKYSGDSNFTSSTTSGTQTLTVNPATTTTTASASVNPSTYGQSVTLSASVQPGSGSGPTGSVTFLDGTTNLGSAPLSSGSASLAIATLAAGTHSMTAQYSGDSNFAVSTSSALSETVNPGATSTAIVSGANPASYGQAVTLTAAVQPPAGTTASGTVTFLDGTTSLGTANLANNSGQLTTSTLAVGPHSLTAAYAGNGNLSASTSSPLTETISQTPTAITFTSNLNPAPFGQCVQFTGTVQTATGGVVTGTVTFYDGSNSIGTATVSNNPSQYNQVLLTDCGFQGGTHTITAKYSGDPNYLASTSSPLTETVNTVSSSVAMTASQNPISYASSVTFSATVQPSISGDLATGSVTFYDGSNALGTVTLPTNEVAQLSLSNLAAGSHSITAKYSGDTNFSASTSSTTTETVNAASTTTTVSSSLNPATYGQSVTFTATVTPPAGTTTSGGVTFLDGTTTLGTVTLSSNSAQLAVTLLAGSHSIAASYGGNGNLAASTSSALAETVSQAATTTSISSNLNPSTSGQVVTFTATIQAAVGSPTGTVGFYDGSTQIGSSTVSANVAQFSTSTLPTGANSITARYSGDTNFVASNSGALTQTVNPIITVTPKADVQISADQGSAKSSVKTGSFSTSAANELLLAFVSADASSNGTNNKVTSVTGGSLSWTLVVRSNTQRGTAEIWRAFATSTLRNVTVTVDLSQSASASITVMSFTGVNTSGSGGSGAIGAIDTSNADPGAPTAQLATTANGSLVIGVGNDWDHATARTLGPNQTLVHQYLSPVDDTYWVQVQSSYTLLSGTTVVINDIAPTTDRYNLAICEILAAP